jgi:hypothetical protein
MNVDEIEKFLREARTVHGPSPLQDAQVNAVIDRVWASQRYPEDGGPRANPNCDPEGYADYGFSILPAQGDLIYLLCRAIRATRVVEFATSVGFSTLYFAAAMRDNGGGRVIGSELVRSKVATARHNLAEAGLANYVDIREGDGRQTLRDLGGPVDFALIDGVGAVAGPAGHRSRGAADPNGWLSDERQWRVGLRRLCSGSRQRISVDQYTDQGRYGAIGESILNGA